MEHEDDKSTMQNNDQNEYALSGKLLLIAVLILFALVVFILLLNLLARWRVVRAHRRELRRRQRLNLRTQLFFYVNERVPGSATLVGANQGLEPEVLNSLPVFMYDSSKEGVEALECAVCLSEFEDDDKGRTLPKCGHCFHAECVDMWFHSHATCPLCRSKVELVKEPEINWTVMCDETVNDETCRHSGGMAKGLEVSIRTRIEDELESRPVVPDGGHVYISSKSRRLSLRRLLSMNRKIPMDVTTSYGVGTSDNVPMETETDLETGST